LVPSFINFTEKIIALINTNIKPFKAHAFHNGKFVSVSDDDLYNKWSAAETRASTPRIILPASSVMSR